MSGQFHVETKIFAFCLQSNIDNLFTQELLLYIFVLINSYQRNHLTEFLRARSSSSIGSCSSLTEIIGEEITRDEDDDSVEQDDSHLTMRTRLASSGEKSISPPSPRDRSVHFER